ncbi:unnamed protein product [Trichogramma brassicae]|uniref:Glucose-methanol-choline oxidoreductase N-terminal domain-containing protein n=1 Tax=Trichogramma brassicae TaxID=86971 RepID=A0A6H5IVD9_9HYME|nr:unnamed protein product [Trichogramma brassicae]
MKVSGALEIYLKLTLICTLSIDFATIAADSDERSTRFRSLYGSSNEHLGLDEAARRFGSAALAFLREGEQHLGHEPPECNPRMGQAFDFVVIGAGSAGATVASRLSEIEDASVLLLEAGVRENLLMDVPVLVNYLQFSDKINWKYQTEPAGKQYCAGMSDQRCNWPRGKVMGGSSVLNYMIATRGNRLDYDHWASLGNDGWSFDELLPYFRKLERSSVDAEPEAGLRGGSGPVTLQNPPFHTPLAEAFLRAGEEMGYPSGVDYNGRGQVGFAYIQASMNNGTRMSSNRAYLRPARHRNNLCVSRQSHVERLLVDPSSKRAYGVEFAKAGRRLRVRSRKEIVLSAGAIGSAQLLMLSGIGPADHLRRMNIDLVQDAPVGENLMDHIAYGGLVFLVDQPVAISTTDLIDPTQPYLADFLQNYTGPLTVPGGCEALAFLDVDRPNDLRAYPNIELLFIGASIVSDFFFHRNVNISKEHWKATFSSVAGRYSWTIFPMIMRPKSRGRILLRSKNPYAKPRIYANYLDDPEDVRVMVEGIRSAIQVSKTKAMQRFKSRLHDVPVYGCENFIYDSDAYWECALRTYTFTIYHHSGTCKMAPSNDSTGVVNPRLQVKGIKGLRVADASIMPTIMTGHTNIPTIMIGEKLADLVKEDWDLKNLY